MKVRYINSKDKYYTFYKIFLEVMGFDYATKEIDSIDKIIIEDTLKLIYRVKKSRCKNMLMRIGIKGYYKLNSLDTKKLLKAELEKMDEYTVLEFYKDNKIELDMFKYEVIEVLDISKYEFSKIKANLKVSGEQIVNVGKYPKKVIKYDRRSIYELLERIYKQ